jgi:uncharacterized protein YecE (DUF72 family)
LRFTPKVFRGFTHKPNTTAADERQFKEGYRSSGGSGRLGTLLRQFARSRKNDKGNRAYLLTCFRRFCDLPWFRSCCGASWNQQAVLDMLAELGISLCNTDQPLFAKSIAPDAPVTSPGRVHPASRLQLPKLVHGNPTDRRPLELPSILSTSCSPWVERIKITTKLAKDTYVVTNNTPGIRPPVLHIGPLPPQTYVQ